MAAPGAQRKRATSALGACVRDKIAGLRAGVQLQPHQQDLVARTRTTPGGMIANWRTGGGKTPGSIAVAEDRGGNALIVVPASLRSNYRQGIEQFTTPDRHKSYTVVSYEQFAKDPEGWIARTRPNTVVADEFHRLRNAGKTRYAFERVRKDIPYMLGNTASLINNRPEELVPLVNLAAGKPLYKSEADFTRQHIKTETVRAKGLAGWLGGAKGEVESIKDPKGLARTLGPHVHRFQGASSFQSNFPEVDDQIVNVELTKRQRAMAKAVLDEYPTLAGKIRNNLPPSKRELTNINAFSVALRQISNNPASFDASVVDQVAESPKFKAMIEEQMRRAKSDPNFRSVVYSNFLGSGVEPIVSEAKKRGLAGRTFTGGLTDKQRATIVSDFNSGRIQTLGLSPAGGEGLDLKGTKLIQIAEGHWNPERARQAIGRGARFKSHAHLPEAERKVTVQRFVGRNPRRWWHKLPGIRPETSIDEWIESRRQEKERLNAKFINALESSK